MKRAKTQYQTAKNASKLHRHIGNLLEELYPNFEIRQEYAVNQINKNYPSGREKFDWVILGLKVVIEIHGEQHYGPVCFGGVSLAEAKKNFVKRIRVDKEKELAALESGWSYLVVKYDEQNIIPSLLQERIIQSINMVSRKTETKKQEHQFANNKFPKTKRKYNWPTRKLKSRSFLRK